VIGYNGTDTYWGRRRGRGGQRDRQRHATAGADGGGNRCALTFAQGGTFWVIGHSMAGPVMDFILGNNDASDPNFNFNGPYDTVAARLSMVITFGGAHRGSQGADLACGQANIFCSFLAQFHPELRHGDVLAAQLRRRPGAELRQRAGEERLSHRRVRGDLRRQRLPRGEDDGIVQHASQYACNGSATASYNNATCATTQQAGVVGLPEPRHGHENHDDERNDADRDTRRAIPTGIWNCGASACTPDTVVQSAMSCAQLVAALY
jgi:hypothetical protein